MKLKLEKLLLRLWRAHLNIREHPCLKIENKKSFYQKLSGWNSCRAIKKTYQQTTIYRIYRHGVWKGGWPKIIQLFGAQKSLKQIAR